MRLIADLNSDGLFLKMYHRIKKIIFIGLDDKQINLLTLLKGEFSESFEDMYFIFMQNEAELIYHIDVNCIVVSHSKIQASIIETMLKNGHPFYLEWADFLRYYHSIMSFQCRLNSQKICLAFLPENFMKLYKSMMSLYGYNVITADDPVDLEQILNSGIEYLVFDMDMNQVSEKIRFQVMQKINYHCKKGLKVNVIKNFDKGSLFNDILSPIKEISNILLSPDEYTLFLRKYLYLKELEMFFRNTPERISAFQNNRQIDEAKSSPRNGQEMFTDLRDSKKSYNQILALKNNPKWQILFQQRNDIDLKYILSMAIEESISRNLENSQRELFTFFPQ